MITLHQLLYQTKDDCVIKVVVNRKPHTDTYGGKSFELQDKTEIVGEAKPIFDRLLHCNAPELSYIAEITTVEAGSSAGSGSRVVIMATPLDKKSEYEVVCSDTQDIRGGDSRDVITAENCSIAIRLANRVAEQHGRKHAWIRQISGVG